jgi:hypothetical protein
VATHNFADSQVRNPLRAAVVHARRADEGRALTGLRAEAWPKPDPQDLATGEAYVLGVGSSGLIRVRVPLLESPTRAPAPGGALRAASRPIPSHFAPASFAIYGSGHFGQRKRPLRPG